jgi:exosortase K
MNGGWLTYVVTALAAFALKLHYSRATVDDLAWILQPTAAVVGWLDGQPLWRHAELGWVAADGRFVIAPVCAGVNFLILGLVLPVASFAHRFRSVGEQCGWVVVAACAAYLLTIAVNAMRIVLAVGLYRMEVHAGWLTPERVHRLAGTITYLLGLWAAWIGFDRLSGRLQMLPSGRGWTGMLVVPAGYLGMTVAVPLANGAWRHFGTRYLEHALTVAGVTAGTVVLLSLTCWATRGRRDGEAVDPRGRG